MIVEEIDKRLSEFQTKLLPRKLTQFKTVPTSEKGTVGFSVL